MISASDAARAALTAKADRWFWVLIGSTIVLFVGAIMEEVHPLDRLHTHDVNTRTQVRTPISWVIRAQRAYARLAVIFVVVGIGGEGFAECFGAKAESAVRNFDNQTAITAGVAAKGAVEDFQKADQRLSGIETKAGSLDTRLDHASTQLGKVENGLTEANKNFVRQSFPRWILLSPLGKFLKHKPTGSVEVIFAPEDTEAELTALTVEAQLGGGARWKVLRGFHAYSEDDALPEYLTLETKRSPFPALLFEKVGGISDITVLFSDSDAAKDPPRSPKSGTAAESLWRGLHACGFQSIAVPEASLPADTVRVVVGKRSATLILEPTALAGKTKK